jgi:hypothetical protein
MACGSSTQVLQQEKEQQKQQQVQEQKQEQEQGLDIMSRASEAEATLLKVFAQRQHNTCAYCLLRASTRTWHLAGCTHHHTTERGQVRVAAHVSVSTRTWPRSVVWWWVHPSTSYCINQWGVQVTCPQHHTVFYLTR